MIEAIKLFLAAVQHQVVVEICVYDGPVMREEVIKIQLDFAVANVVPLTNHPAFVC